MRKSSRRVLPASSSGPDCARPLILSLDAGTPTAILLDKEELRDEASSINRTR